MTDTKTPGYNHRLDIWFQTTKRGQRVAYYWSYAAVRAIRLSLVDAELFIATDQATQLPGHPMKSDPAPGTVPAALEGSTVKATTLLNRFGHEITEDEAIALLGTGEPICNGYRHELLADEVGAIIRQRQAEDIGRQYAQAARWASLLQQAGYPAELHGTGQAEPFHQEWRVFDGPRGSRIATIDIDGCGASWHGPDDLWLTIIGPHSDLPESE